MPERIKTSAKDLRIVASEILENSHDILQINSEAVDGVLTESLRSFDSANLSTEFSEDSLSAEDELGLNLFFNVVNFCYQNPYTKTDYVYRSSQGSKVFRSTGLKKAMTESGISWYSTSEVANMTAEKWRSVAQLDENSDFFMGEERGTRIARFAHNLEKMGFLDVNQFLSAAKYDTKFILAFLNGTPFFKDEFQKRSQLAVNMLDGVLKRRFGSNITGTENLTVMADYRLPQLMYNMEAINLSEELNQKLLDGEILETGSPDEKALRAASIVIGKKLSDNLGITEGKTDSLLWTLAVTLGRQNKMTIPHMLVATDKY